MPAARTPHSTYRLQFNKSFTFAHATGIVDYLHQLGISDCYASSYLAAIPGSTHGYDVADPTRLNPELGTEDDYWEWIAALRARGMGHLLDLVPNHMGIAKSANPFWQDVLENGACSRFARFFDIDWRPVKVELHDKVLLPILGDQYGAALEAQQLRLAFDPGGTFVVHCYDNLLPIAPDTFTTILGTHLEPWIAGHAGPESDELQSILTASRNLPSRSSREPEDISTRAREKEIVKRRLSAVAMASSALSTFIAESVTRLNGVVGDPRSFDELDLLLNQQSYRLAYWRVASEEINYRRFFDVNELAALRMEDPVVFEEIHRFALDLVQRGAPTGLRIDHVDGLFDPAEYLRRLEARCGERFYIVVEKILGSTERLPENWPVAGTTGYEFAAIVNNLFVDGRNEHAFDDTAARFARGHALLPFGDLAYRCRKQVMHETMSGDINALGHRLNLFSERNRHYRDFTLYSLISTLKEIIACFPVYRTYIAETEPVRDQDRTFVTEATVAAKRRAPHIPALVFDFIERLLLKETPSGGVEDAAERAAFTGKFQQITSPVAAKGIEDTALYLYPRLLSLNDVGSDPTIFGADPSEVHTWMLSRQADWPAALSATSTHDSKRSEDVRARLNVLSEIPGAWKLAVLKWRALNRRFKRGTEGNLAPDPDEEYFLYQTLVGAWPFELAEGPAADPVARDEFEARMHEYMLKALRESKVHTSWINPDAAYERAVLRFVSAILDHRRASPFLEAFIPFQARVAELGIYNSLAQLLIKITAPGIPDFYQGGELWDLRLVDPDNRRPVDYDRRRRMLESLTPQEPDEALATELLTTRTDGRIKMFLMSRALAARRQAIEAFGGAYLPLAAIGTRRESVFAFARHHGRSCAITCVPRLLASMIPDASRSSAPPVGDVWLDTRLPMPAGTPSVFRNVFTGATVRAAGNGDGERFLAVSEVFAAFPVALLVAE